MMDLMGNIYVNVILLGTSSHLILVYMCHESEIVVVCRYMPVWTMGSIDQALLPPKQPMMLHKMNCSPNWMSLKINWNPQDFSWETGWQFCVCIWTEGCLCGDICWCLCPYICCLNIETLPSLKAIVQCPHSYVHFSLFLICVGVQVLEDCLYSCRGHHNSLSSVNWDTP